MCFKPAGNGIKRGVENPLSNSWVLVCLMGLGRSLKLKIQKFYKKTFDSLNIRSFSVIRLLHLL